MGPRGSPMLGPLTPSRRVTAALSFFARPSADKDTDTLFPGSDADAKNAPPLVGFGKSKPTTAPGVKETLTLTGTARGDSPATATYSRFGECPSWMGSPGATCALELNYVRSNKWDQVPEGIRRMVDRFAPKIRQLPYTAPGMAAYMRVKQAAATSKGWFKKKE
uniref:Uncharacterized protein n=1 Tax=Phaeomonas parva TaxID=124430 RepID=A0A7S1TZI7_9STRA